MNFIEKNVKMGRGVFIGSFVYIRQGCFIGDNVVIGHNTTIEENVFIGHGTRIQANCYITKRTIIHDDVFIAPSVSTLNDMYICSHGRKKKSALVAPVIHRGARIGGGVVIAPEVVIGENAMIGCGSLVLVNIPAEEMWYGSPARKIRMVPKDELI